MTLPPELVVMILNEYCTEIGDLITIRKLSSDYRYFIPKYRKQIGRNLRFKWLLGKLYNDEPMIDLEEEQPMGFSYFDLHHLTSQMQFLNSVLQSLKLPSVNAGDCLSEFFVRR
jgi:hypothetical protein